MSVGKYILIGHDVLRVDDLIAWANWVERANTRVALDEIEVPDGTIKVSTIFLSVDHNFLFDGPPILFETMVFGGTMHHHQERYCTWDDAVRGHKEILKHVQEVLELERMTQ